MEKLPEWNWFGSTADAFNAFILHFIMLISFRNDWIETAGVMTANNNAQLDKSNRYEAFWFRPGNASLLVPGFHTGESKRVGFHWKYKHKLFKNCLYKLWNILIGIYYSIGILVLTRFSWKHVFSMLQNAIKVHIFVHFGIKVISFYKINIKSP